MLLAFLQNLPKLIRKPDKNQLGKIFSSSYHNQKLKKDNSKSKESRIYQSRIIKGINHNYEK